MEFFIVLIVAAIILIIVIGKQNPDALKNSLGANPSHFKSNSSKEVSIEITMDVAYEGPDLPEVEVTEEEIDARVEEYAFVVESKRPKQLTGTESWFKKRNQNKFLKTEPERALDWILPFIPGDVATIDKLKPHVERGPISAGLMMKEIRAMIRSRRKLAEPYQDLLEAMYGLAVLIDLESSLNANIKHHESSSVFVPLKDLQNIPIDYQKIGYEFLKSPLQTDCKWFVENFGEPMDHMSIEDYFSQIRRIAISRGFWKRFSTEHSLKGTAAEINALMSQWLRKEAASDIKWEKIAITEVKQHTVTTQKKTVPVEKAIKATQVPFVVADLETTGLNANQHEITEIGAILVDPDGTITSEFSSLIKINNSIPSRITELTGIDDNLVRAEGRNLKEVLEEFLGHTKGRPIFFHYAPFDQSFLNAACEAYGLKLENEIYDTLPIARKAWPSLGQYKLSTLAEFLELDQPNHRALQDARATLSVLLASRDTLKV